jgi:hypothetical protein
MTNNTRVEITIKFSANLDQFAGWGDCAEDWITVITKDFVCAEHYKAEAEIINVSYTERK